MSEFERHDAVIGEQLIGLFIQKGPDHAWEPRSGRSHPHVQAMIEGGWLRPCVLRAGFEAMDTGVTWTNAAIVALQFMTGARVEK